MNTRTRYRCSALTPYGRFDASVYFDQKITHTVPGHPGSVKQGLQVQGVPAGPLMFPWDVHLHPSVPHGPGELPMRRVHGQEQPVERTQSSACSSSMTSARRKQAPVLLPEVGMWGDFGGHPVYDAAFVDGEGSTGLQQSIETIQDGRAKRFIFCQSHLLNA